MSLLAGGREECSMKFDIHPETVRKADKCVHDKCCLSGSCHTNCNITRSVNDSVFFVDGPESLYCPYQMSFGNSFICTCPVRQEIYKKYKV